jgi:hypothetical protein
MSYSSKANSPPFINSVVVAILLLINEFPTDVTQVLNFEIIFYK